MQTRRFLRPLCLVASLAIVVFVTSARNSDARAPYKKGFEKLYELRSPRNGTVTCAVCHPSGEGKTKRHLNHYGQALAEELGNREVKDMDRILEALKEIEKGKCKSGEWKDRLEHGLPPCVCGGRDAESYISRQLNRAGYESR